MLISPFSVTCPERAHQLSLKFLALSATTKGMRKLYLAELYQAELYLAEFNFLLAEFRRRSRNRLKNMVGQATLKLRTSAADIGPYQSANARQVGFDEGWHGCQNRSAERLGAQNEP